MRKILLSVVLLLALPQLRLSAQVSYSFENGLPSQVKLRGRGELSLSSDRYKDGNMSLKFSWQGQSELMLVEPKGIAKSMLNEKNGLTLWLCNENPDSQPLRIAFKDAKGSEICYFNVDMGFRGWRAVWVRYCDMHNGEKYYGEIDKAERPAGAVYLSFRPSPAQINGSFYIDRLAFSERPLHHQIAPDKQIPDNNHFISRRNIWHWARLWEWERNPRLKGEELDEEKRASLELISRHLDEFYEPKNSSFDAAKSRQALEKRFNEMSLERLADGSVKGRPIVSNDEAGSGDIKMQAAFSALNGYAVDYYFTSEPKSLERFFLIADHLLWQGVDFGSGMGTNHHYGYNIRGWNNALWIMRKEIAEAGKMPAYLAALEYWSGLAECRAPYEEGRDEIVDSWNTLLMPKLTAAMLQPTEEERYANMAALASWVSSSMKFTPGTIGGIKIDGTAFHHGGHYPAYAVGAYSTLGSYFRIVLDSDFRPDEEAIACAKKGLMAMRNYCNLYDWGIGISGRHPFGDKIPAQAVEAFGYLSIMGGEGKYDPELGGAYLALKGSDKEVTGKLKKAGIRAANSPEGFFVYNYGAFGIHRRKGWMLTLKAYNSDVWGSEIYAKDNRYGRYQSYGSVQVINSGNPASAADSRYSEEGWDWNRMPGTTSIHLPFDKLNSPLKGTLMERNLSRFPGVSSLEGKNGVMAFTYREKDRVNFSAGATAKKSVFCFDNRIVFIGTDICNKSDFPTETTVFQQKLANTSEAVIIDDALFSAFPQAWRGKAGEKTLLEDLKGNCYIFKDAGQLMVLRQRQSSPDNTDRKQGTGDFVTAYLDHGISPEKASYEYLMLVEPSSSERSKCLRKLPYEVLRADSAAHVVRDAESGITAYVCYEDYLSESTLVKAVPAETIVMERREKDGSIVLSVCSPDLGIEDKSYTTPEPSKVIVKEINVNGKIIKAECIHGQPVEFRIN